MKTAAATCSHLVQYAGPSLSDLTDAHLASSPTPATKSPGWLLGHLSVSGDFLRRKAGRPPLTPKEWGPRFTPGSVASPNAADYPRMVELRDAFNAVYVDLAAAAPTFSAELLAGPNPFEPSRPRFSNFGEFALWIMTGHLGYHLGQLSGWRAAAGLPLRPGARSPWL
jgi:hypothetical protein